MDSCSINQLTWTSFLNQLANQKLVLELEVFREDIPRAAQYVNSDSVLQQCILCRLDVAICLQSIKSGGFLKIFSKRL